MDRLDSWTQLLAMQTHGARFGMVHKGKVVGLDGAAEQARLIFYTLDGTDPRARRSRGARARTNIGDSCSRFSNTDYVRAGYNTNHFKQHERLHIRNPLRGRQAESQQLLVDLRRPLLYGGATLRITEVMYQR